MDSQIEINNENELRFQKTEETSTLLQEAFEELASESKSRSRKCVAILNDEKKSSIILPNRPIGPCFVENQELNLLYDHPKGCLNLNVKLIPKREISQDQHFDILHKIGEYLVDGSAANFPCSLSDILPSTQITGRLEAYIDRNHDSYRD